MIKANSMTTKMFVELIIAIKNRCRYYNHTGCKIKAFKFVAKRKQLKKK